MAQFDMRKFFPILFLMVFSGCNSSNKLSENLPKTNETVALYKNLKDLAKRGIMFGHQDDVAYGIGWKGGDFNSDVEKVCGDYPAVFGWDIGHIDSTMNLDSVSFSDMRRWMVKVFEKGGINTVSWHERNLATKGSSWDTTSVVSKILPDGELNGSFNRQLDNVAAFFNSLITENGAKVPVIFRPFHEHNGSWFWWGEEPCNDELYKELWIYTHKYLTEEKEVDNLLFCYSTDVFDSAEDYLSRYPGDEYVDILGFDDYHSIISIETQEVFINRLVTINSIAKEKDKVALLSETGYETIPDESWWTNVLLDGFKKAQNTERVAYLLVWRNARLSHHYAPYPGHPSSEDFIKFKNDYLTIFLGDLPNMYQ